MQETKGIIVSEESNMTFQAKMLFKMHLDYSDLVTRDIQQFQPNPEKLVKTATFALQNFDDSISSNYEPDTRGSKYVYHIRNEEYGNAIDTKIDIKKFAGAKWIKASGKFMYRQPPPFYFRHILVLEIPAVKLWSGCKIENKINGGDPNFYRDHEVTLDYYEINKWGYVYYYVKVPDNLSDGDQIKLFVWNMGHTDLYMDDLCIELYK